MTRSEGLAALQEAARSETGLLLQVSNVEAIVIGLSRIAKSTLREELMRLQYRRVALPDGNLAIINPPHEAEIARAALPPEITL